jgi:hypothetical protein
VEQTKKLRRGYSPSYWSPVRRQRAARLLCAVVVGLVGLPLAAPLAAAAPPAPQPFISPATGGGWQDGLIGFITNDGLFFVEVGATDFLGLFTPYYNGSQIYTYQVDLNITAVTGTAETAYIHLTVVGAKQPLANLTVPLGGYANDVVQITLPTVHSWTEVKIAVDGTPGYFYWATPYTFAPIGNLFNGGIDFAVFAALGVYMLVAYVVSAKAQQMTKRAVYAPEWKAVMWLHGIFFGFVALYAIDFVPINMALQGWEILLIPIPEAIFTFFWTAGRHSRRIVFDFSEPLTIQGRPLSKIRRTFYGGIDPDGNIVLIKYNSRSLFQWYYRSKGYHVKVWAMYDDGRPATRLSAAHQSVLDQSGHAVPKASRASPVEPLVIPVYDYESLTPEQLRDPSRIPRSGLYDQFRGAAVTGVGGNEKESVSYEFVVVSNSDFQVKWPHFSWWRTEVEPDWADPEGNIHKGEPRQRFSPHIEPGSAQVTLLSWHGQDIYMQNYGVMDMQDLVQENDNLSAALWMARGELHRLSGMKAEAKITAYREMTERADRELEQPESEELVEHYRSTQERKRLDPSASA